MPFDTSFGAASLKSRVKLRNGEPYVITFNFERYMKYAELGAGKGRGGLKGSKWTDKFGVKKSTSPKSLGRMGKDGRYPQPFSDNTINEQLPILTQKLANELADSVAKFITQPPDPRRGRV